MALISSFLKNLKVGKSYQQLREDEHQLEAMPSLRLTLFRMSLLNL